MITLTQPKRAYVTLRQIAQKAIHLHPLAHTHIHTHTLTSYFTMKIYELTVAYLVALATCRILLSLLLLLAHYHISRTDTPMNRMRIEFLRPRDWARFLRFGFFWVWVWVGVGGISLYRVRVCHIKLNEHINKIINTSN